MPIVGQQWVSLKRIARPTSLTRKRSRSPAAISLQRWLSTGLRSTEARRSARLSAMLAWSSRWCPSSVAPDDKHHVQPHFG